MLEVFRTKSINQFAKILYFNANQYRWHSRRRKSRPDAHSSHGTDPNKKRRDFLQSRAGKLDPKGLIATGQTSSDIPSR